MKDEKRRIEGTDEDRIILNLVYDMAINKYHVNEFKLSETFDKIKEFCIEKDRLTFEYLWKYLISSKLLKSFQFDIESLKQEAKEIIEEFNRLIEELNKGRENENERTTN
ncbi:MAG: hypothetical protein MJZ37_08250 [Bacilli bacterium]|nr:hypothetical protein [Bacilli bacterium]